MNKIEFVEEITERTTQIAAHFSKDHQYIMLLATVEHKLDEAQVKIVADEYISRPQADRDVVVFTAWDAGVKSAVQAGDMFAHSVDIRLGSRENQKRAKKGGMIIRETLNDDIFAEFVEASQNYWNAVSYYCSRIEEGTSPPPPDMGELRGIIQALKSELDRLKGLYDA